MGQILDSNGNSVGVKRTFPPWQSGERRLGKLVDFALFAFSLYYEVLITNNNNNYYYYEKGWTYDIWKLQHFITFCFVRMKLQYHILYI